MLLANFERRLPDLLLRAAFLAQEGSTLVLWGESGSGKTSILSCIAGLESPDRGEIVLQGRPLFSSSRGLSLPPRERGIGYLFQDYALFPHLSALGNILFALGGGWGGGGAGRREAARLLLDRFGLGRCARRRPSELSGGERQRLAFARAIARKPSLLLLDEPWSALDRRTRGDMHREFLEWRAITPVTTILVTHDRREAELFATDIHEVREGEVML